MFKNLLHKITPSAVVSWYHRLLAWLANYFYGQPSRHMIVIGITGTSGKSTTCELLWNILSDQGLKVGLASGIRFFDGKNSIPNNTKMTMVGRFRLQKILSAMKLNGYQYAIIEVTSQGLSQWRHSGINFDLVMITNLWSEHDQAHGGFENYKKAKGLLFKSLGAKPRKKINDQLIKKTLIANADDEHFDYFFNFVADNKLGFSLKRSDDNILQAKRIRTLKSTTTFSVNNQNFKINLLGEHNIYNALAAVTAAYSLGIGLEQSDMALKKITGIPGRLEFIDEGQDFSVIVDYAFEPKAMAKLYEVIKQLPHQKVIHVLGTTGGGRDSKRGEILGAMAGDFADYVVATDEDPYDDDPITLINRVATGAQNHGKETDKNLFIKKERLDGIAKGISLAQTGDIVLITGKGSEGAMCVANNKKIPWDDRQVAREILKNNLADVNENTTS